MTPLYISTPLKHKDASCLHLFFLTVVRVVLFFVFFYLEVLRELAAELFLLKKDSRNILEKQRYKKKKSHFPIVKLNNFSLTAYAVLIKEQ